MPKFVIEREIPRREAVAPGVAGHLAEPCAVLGTMGPRSNGSTAA